MTWVKVDDRAFEDPRFLELERGTGLLHFEALAYSNRNVTGGRVTLRALRALTPDPDPVAAADALVAAGLWSKTEDGYTVVWLLDDQPSVEEVERQREYNRGKQARHRRHLAGDHSGCDPRWCRGAQRNPVSNRVTTVVSNSPRPDPTVGRGTGVGTAAPARPAAGGRVPDDEDSGSCSRCGVAAEISGESGPDAELDWIHGDEGDLFCPTCRQFGRHNPGSCMALTKPGKNGPGGEPCAQRVKEGQQFCQYHQQERSRGKNPAIGQGKLDQIRERVSQPRPVDESERTTI
jgi:hypothetical protein